MLLFLGAAILAILIQLAASSPTTANTTLHIATDAFNLPDNFLSWASFCNDESCTEGCGEWVDITNTGCLVENYRRSIKFKSDNGPEVRGGLIYSPSNTCNCQTVCEPFFFPNGAGCMTLNTSISYESFSYRIVGHGQPWPCDGTSNDC